MKNVFNNMPSARQMVKVNTQDWSHSNNLTFNLGQIVPCFCAKLPPKSSFTMSPKFALKLMPMVFPIQTPLKTRLSVFKIPIRALWKDYKDWQSSVNTPAHKKYDPPFLSKAKTLNFEKTFGNGSLADYLGIPSTYDGVIQKLSLGVQTNAPVYLSHFPVVGESLKLSSDATGLFLVSKTLVNLSSTGVFDSGELTFSSGKFNFSGIKSFSILLSSGSSAGSNVLSVSTSVSFSKSGDSYVVKFDDVNTLDFKNNFDYHVLIDCNSVSVGTGQLLSTSLVLKRAIDDYNFDTCPWFSNAYNPDGLKLADYGHRLYHSIYNAYIRNIRNNPRLDKDGNPIYNDYTPFYEYGGDVLTSLVNDKRAGEYDEFLSLHYSNWEYDQFSTAVPSPQQGVAPLVGLTTYSQTLVNENGVQYNQLNSVLTDESGKSYKVNYKYDADGLRDVEYTELQDLGSVGQPISKYAAMTEGIKIEDIRNVNAYQRYLERNMRSGYSYKDIIENRYDVRVKYDDLLMPEFCGGFTRDVDVNAVTQTVQTVPAGTTYDGALGSQAGDSMCFGSTGAHITGYCDEESILMVLVSMTPLPIYTQHLPKWFLDRDVLDTPTPEFQNIGFQPISNAEIAPIQYWNNDKKNTRGTFGYQRPWYQYLQQPDVAHGDFRGPLRSFIMNRVFEGTPKLNKDFTIFNPDHVNDVFNVNEGTHKVFGQVRFDDFIVKLPISRDCVPNLE